MLRWNYSISAARGLPSGHRLHHPVTITTTILTDVACLGPLALEPASHGGKEEA